MCRYGHLEHPLSGSNHWIRYHGTNGRGEFYDKEPLDGRIVLARTVVTNIKPNSYRAVIAFSQDGGKTWEVNWIADYTRIR